MTTHIDLYAIHRLDRSASPQALAAALTAQLQSTDPRDAVTRGRIETARAILGDPTKRAGYDRQLADPAAPPITEQTLAQLAGVPVAQPVPQRRSGLFSNPKTQILSGVAALLALILLVTVAAVSCGGGSSSPNATSGPDGAADDSVVSCQLQSNRQIKDAEWEKKSRQPRVVIVLDKAIDLPEEFNQLTAYTASVLSGDPRLSEGLTQYPGGSVGVVITDGGVGGRIPETFGGAYIQSVLTIATVSPEGAVTSTRQYRYGSNTRNDTLPSYDTIPESITPRRDQISGSMRIQASNGIEIPSAAESSEQSKVYTLSVLPDANDPNVAWVLLLGSSKLYKATLYRATGTDATDLGTVIDPSKCTK